MNIGEWLDRGSIVGHSGAATKKQALAALAELAGRAFGIDSDEAGEALAARIRSSPFSRACGRATP